ncbi:2,5-dihydroxypyridine 5,6-dioxygenase [Variovorax sp. LjRoot175]|uniref:2,5-dihydroxypyridine 5,6-dioxygenase n=1 Tax=Variovorax sp. LjRoot175 TaxID=3342276 RepID=UPI003ED0AB31
MSSQSLQSAWHHLMSLSKVSPEEKVVVLGSLSGRNRYKDVALRVLDDMGAAVSYVEVGNPHRVSASALPALRAAGLIVDLTHSHDPVFRQLGRDGVRTLTAVEPPEILLRMLPQASDKTRVQHAQSCIRAAKTMRVTSPAGTDFEVALGELNGNCQYGFADDPGHWDQCPGAFVVTYSNDGSAQGTVVIDAGDMIFPQKEYVHAPITLHLENGYITAIEGGMDAKLLKATLDAYRNPEVFAVSHLGWGLSRNSRWDALKYFDKAEIEGQDGRGHLGNFLFSTGPNLSGGGTRRAPMHLDIPLAGCSVYLDGKPMVLDGDVVSPEQRPS